MQFPKKRTSDIFKVRDTGPIYITSKGVEQLKDKLGKLKQALPKYIEETKKAAAYGDRSDSAEYKEAKSTLRRTHRQILSIEDKLKRIVIIMPTRNKTGKVQLGSTVLLELKDGSQKKFQILGPHETDPSKGRISHLSPLGATLINHKKGDLISIETPSGSQEYKILEID